jgi:hypothetical protein
LYVAEPSDHMRFNKSYNVCSISSTIKFSIASYSPVIFPTSYRANFCVALI